MKRFDNRYIFEHEMNKGINLFLGAGFSILAKNSADEFLPVGNKLSDKIFEDKELNIDKKFKALGLSKVSTIIESTNKDSFQKFLRKEFTVKSFDKLYFSIVKLNPKSVYTTNIDNLIKKIYEKVEGKYINDVTFNGEIPNDSLAVNFSALHGNVEYENRDLIFDVASINNAYTSNPRIWHQLGLDFERFSTLFWGYQLADSGVIQALTSSNLTNNDSHKNKWIILRNEDSDDGTIAYFEALKFNIIISDTKEFLEYLSNINIVDNSQSFNSNDKVLEKISKNLVPKNNKNLTVRPIIQFLKGNPPTWFDIFSFNIIKTSHFDILKNYVYSNKNLIIEGAPVSGKTTLMMQLAITVDYDIKLIFDNISFEKAELVKNILKDKRAIVFIDNFSDSLQAFNLLAMQKNIKLVGVERTHNFSVISHLIDSTKFNFHNVTALSDSDLQEIYNHLPISDRKSTLRREINKNYDKDTIFEFIRNNVKGNSIQDRFKEVFNEFKNVDERLSEFLVLIAYTHRCRVPISFDMLFSYFKDEINSYKEIYELREHLDNIVKDYKDYSGDLQLEPQDYYYPRSYFIAETIINVVEAHILKKVLLKTLEAVPNVRIPFYDTYHKYAYDKKLAVKAFPNFKEGIAFYELAYERDFNNPYVLQQGALYLAQKKQFTKAFEWIDRAITQTNNRYFSIRNSHAIILFDANINAQEDIDTKSQLDNSMDILERCFNDDNRKVFHAITYAEQAIKYYKRYGDSKAKEYVLTAIKWIKLEQKNSRVDRNLTFKLKDLEKLI